MVSFLFAVNSLARAFPRVPLPQDGQEGCLPNFGGSKAASALSPTLLAAKLCCATWPFKVFQGCPVKLHVAIFFAALSAQVTLSIPRRQSKSCTLNTHTLLPVVAAMVPHVFLEGTLWQFLFASTALEGTLRALFAQEIFHGAGLSIVQRVCVKGFVAACVPTTTLALV